MVNLTTAFVLVSTQNGREHEVLSELEGLPQIEEKWLVYGDYDILLRVETKDIDELNELMVEKLRSIKDILSTTTLLGV